MFHLVSSRREVEGRGSFQGHPANIEGTPPDNRVNPLRRSMVFISFSLSCNSIRHVSIECHVVRPIRSGDSSVVFLNNTLTVRVEHGVYAWKVRDETETALIGRRSKRTKESRTTKWRRNFKEISRGILCLYLPPYAQNQWKIFTVSPNKFFRDTEIISSTFVKASVPLIPRVLDRFFVPALVCRIGLIHSLVNERAKTHPPAPCNNNIDDFH